MSAGALVWCVALAGLGAVGLWLMWTARALASWGRGAAGPADSLLWWSLAVAAFLAGAWFVGSAVGLALWVAAGCPPDDPEPGAPLDARWDGELRAFVLSERGAGQGGGERPTPADRAGGPGPRGRS